MISKTNWRILTSRIMSSSSNMTIKDTEAAFNKSKSQLRRMFDAGVHAVLPSSIIKNSITVNKDHLKFGEQSFSLSPNVYLVGFGKAVMSMASAMESKLQSRLKKGIVSVPRGSIDKFFKSQDAISDHLQPGKIINYRENSVNNQPDSDTLRTTREIVHLIENLEEDDTLIVLISGGGSALLCMPDPKISFNSKLELCKKLQNSGADIGQLNVVRKKLSMVKGGGLARMARNTPVISLIISDIVGDPIDVIASGPTVFSRKDPEEVLKILKKYNLWENVDEDLRDLLNSTDSKVDDDLLNDRGEFLGVHNVIIGNNNLAIEAATKEAHRMGLSPYFLSNIVEGSVEEVSRSYATITSLVCRVINKTIDKETFLESMFRFSWIGLSMEELAKMFDALEVASGEGVILLGAGEPTVKVTGLGKGGRNQELALRFSLDWLAFTNNDSRYLNHEVMFLSAGTDGQDGPTDACGAFGYSAIEPIVCKLIDRLKRLVDEKNDPLVRSMLNEALKIVPKTVLKNNDSYKFYSRFNRGKDLLKTGLTGTNVADLHFVVIKKRQRGWEIDYLNEVEKDPHLVDDHDLRGDSDGGVDEI